MSTYSTTNKIEKNQIREVKFKNKEKTVAKRVDLKTNGRRSTSYCRNCSSGNNGGSQHLLSIRYMLRADLRVRFPIYIAFIFAVTL